MSSSNTAPSLRRCLFDALRESFGRFIPHEVRDRLRVYSFEQIAVSGETFLELVPIADLDLTFGGKLAKWEHVNVLGWALAEFVHGDRGGFAGMLAQETDGESESGKAQGGGS